jgi:hypothetical protein
VSEAGDVKRIAEERGARERAVEMRKSGRALVLLYADNTFEGGIEFSGSEAEALLDRIIADIDATLRALGVEP